ncbi:MAG: two-component regulator propeller domain-containing protein, partial [Candidatus Thalassarchaeaceae archaeon]
ILAGTTVHSYDTRTLIFQSQNQLSTLGLYQNGATAIPWPAHPGRGPTSSTSLFSDGSGILAMQIAENPAGTLTLVSSPSLDGMEVVASIDDDESGEIWVAGGTIIDRFDALSQSWLNPIDISDYVTNPGQIVSIEQDGNNKVWIGTSNAGVLRLQNTDATYIGNVGGLSSSEVSSLAYDEINAFLVVGHSQSGISIINTNTMTLVDTITTSDGLDSDFVRSVATRYGI